MTPDQLCAAALQQQVAGDFARAEALYRAALEQNPQLADALHRLGRVLHAQGQSEAAIGLIEQAIRLKARNAEFRDALGLALRSAGRDAEAAEAFRHAVRLDKSSFAAHYNLGNALASLGQPVEAAQCFRRAIAIDPKFAGAHNNLGNALRAAGEHARAADAFRAAIALEPGASELHFNLGSALVELNRDAEAVAALTRAVAIEPSHGRAMVLLSDVCHRGGDSNGAVEALRRAIALLPHSVFLVSRLAFMLHMLGREDEAGPYFRLALRLAPEDAKIHGDYGIWLRETGDLAGSETHIRAGLAIDPDEASLHYSLAQTLLCMERMREGLAEYEWRWKAHGIASRHNVPAWNGAASPGHTLLVSAEQGQGDMIQFLRYVPLAAERMRVVLETSHPLRRLAEQIPGIAAVFCPGDPVPAHDFVCPLLSLPRALGRDEAPLGMDAANPYLQADSDDIARWGERLAPLPGRRVGLVWAGAANFALDRRRSVPPALLDALPQAGCSYFSLQKDAAARPDLPLIDWTDELRDFADTAALIANLDLVIAVDTAVAHLAGAIGRPVWLLNRFDADWRWRRTGETTEWYPTMRQFRQPRLGDWESVIAAVRLALAA